jgi:ribonuclease HIII
MKLRYNNNDIFSVSYMVNIVKSLYTIGVDEVGRGCLAGPVVAAAFACPSQELRKMDLYG